jgi:hypothetical protein
VRHGLGLAKRQGMMSMHQVADSRACCDCGLPSPNTETSYTLISSRYGWRLEIVVVPGTGKRRSLWRCPSCWKNRKGAG